MKCGEMRTRIQILLKPDPVRYKIDLNPERDILTTLWAKKEDKIQEWRWSSSINATRKKQLIIRWRKDIDETMKIRIGTDIFNILGISDFDSTKQWIVILIGMVVDSGP